MGVTQFQRTVCRRIASSRVAGGESYVAGGVALNAALGATRISRDIDLFHDTREALATTSQADLALLGSDFDVEVLRERPTFVEAVVSSGQDSVVVEWVCDSAYRFFPLVEHEDFGLALHPFDLATNKLLALVGRVEARDWIDIMACCDKLQPLGYLAWAACGKDPGYGPAMILDHARRTRHSAAEIAMLQFDGPPPDAAELSTRWRMMLDQAEATIDVLPPDHVGRCILDTSGKLFTGSTDEARAAVAANGLVFHEGSIRGALPSVRER